MPHFLDDRDITPQQRLALLDATWAIKHGGKDPGQPLAGKQVAVYMSKPSLRTRVSFTVAIRRLGGDTIEVGAQNTKLGKGEELQEWAGVLGRMVDVIVARVYGQEELDGLAEFSGGVPVINALSDLLHPCQGLADAFTVYEHARKAGKPNTGSAGEFYAQPQSWAYLGDGNNITHTMMFSCAQLGVTLRCACPEGHMPNPEITKAAQALHPKGADGIIVGSDADAAVDGVDVVHADTWVSMGQEGAMDADEVRRRFEPFRVDDARMAKAAPNAIFMHCLPAEPGKEVTPEVLRGPRSVILDQAENRLWTTMALLATHTMT
jgi:ornithine carbamoyltransferase